MLNQALPALDASVAYLTHLKSRGHRQSLPARMKMQGFGLSCEASIHLFRVVSVPTFSSKFEDEVDDINGMGEIEKSVTEIAFIPKIYW
jgi:hypothetical protein